MVFPRLRVKATLAAALCVLCVLESTNADSSSSSGSLSVLTQASVPVTCSLTVSEGDAAFGINIETDTSCANGGVGCIDNVCRFCKTTDNAQSSHFQPCASIGAVGVSDSCAAAQGDIDVGVTAVADTSCADGGLGCYNSHCRYCKFRTTAQSAQLLSCSEFGYASESQSSSGSVISPATGCMETVSEGDAADGIAFASDPSCAQGGLGCYGPVCRFCQVTATPQSAHLFPCSDFTQASSGDSFGQTLDLPFQDGSSWTSTAPSSSGAMTETDAPSSSQVLATPAVTTATSSSTDSVDTPAPFDPTSDSPTIDPSTTASSSSGVTDTPTTTSATATEPSTDASSNTSATDIPTSADITGSPVVTEPAPSSSGVSAPHSTIDQPISSTSASAAGAETPISIEPSTDTPTQTTDTTDTEAPITLTPTSTETLAPIVVQTESPVPAPTEFVCPEVGAGDAAVGIQLITDPSCAIGGLGCYANACRFCKFRPTAQSAHLLSCSEFGFAFGTQSSSGSTATSPNPTVDSSVCTESVSEGDAAVGIAFASDPTCAQGGLGCYGAICRFCQVSATPQSAHLFPCSDFTQASGGSSFGQTLDLPSGDGSTWTSIAPSSSDDVTDASSWGAPSIDGSSSSGITKKPPATEPSTDAPSSSATYDTPAPFEPPSGAPSSTDGIDTPAPFEPVTDAPSSTDTPYSSGSANTPSASGMTDTLVSTDSPVISPSIIDASDISDTTDPSTNASSSSTDVTETPVAITDVPYTPDITEPSTNAPSTTGTTDAPSPASASPDVLETPIPTEPSTDTPSLYPSTSSTDTPAQTTFVTPVSASASSESPAPSTVDAETPVPTSTVSVCPPVSDGDAAVGIQLISDPSCAIGGLGCYANACRFCKFRTTTQSDHLLSCSQFGIAFGLSSSAGSVMGTSVNASVCLETVSQGDTAAGIAFVTDATCAQGGLGCYGSVCRFCQVTSTPQSSHLRNCSDFTTQTPTPSLQTSAPSSTAITTSPTPTTASHICSVSGGDAVVGISAVVDTTCASGGLGCFSSSCRFCQARTTLQSQHLLNCTTLGAPTVTTMKAAAVSSADESTGLDKILEDGTYKWMITAAAGFGVAAMVAMMAFTVKDSIRQLVNSITSEESANDDEENPKLNSASGAGNAPTESSIADEV